MSYEIRFKNPIYTGLYGVRFDGTHSQGTRLADCRHLKFQMETDTDELRDRYAERPGPFHLRECVSVYNSSTGKQEIIGYEEDANWNSIKDNGNRMIEFPKFWYKRPNAWEFWVSDHDEPGFLPSPMHYRNGKFYDYVYISRYRISTAGESKPNQPYLKDSSYVSDGISTLVKYRNLIRSKGMYMIDYRSYYMWCFLTLIKYGQMNFDKIINQGFDNLPDTGGSSISMSKDSMRLSGGNNKVHHRILGLESPIGTGFYVDGIMRDHKNGIYIHPDIASLNNTSYITSFSGWMYCSKLLPAPYTKETDPNQYVSTINSLVYDTNYPYLLYPFSITNGYIQDYSKPIDQIPCYNSSWDPIGDVYAYAFNPQTSVFNNKTYYNYSVFIACTSALYGSGVLSLYTIYNQYNSANWNTTLGMFFSDSYTT